MKQFARNVVSLLFWILVSPLSLPVHLSRRFDRNDHLFRFGSQCVSLLPGLPGVYARRAYYVTVLPRCGRDVVIEFGTVFAQRDTEIGARVYVGAFCNVGTSRIADDVLIGSNVDVISGRHIHYCDDPETPIRDQGGHFEKIAIGEGSWLGNRSVIMADIGQHAVVGAGAVVVTACESYTINVGNPARNIRSRLDELDDVPEEQLQHAQSA